MKKIKLIGVIILIVALCFTLTACGEFEGYDDDNAIWQGGFWSSFSNTTVSREDFYSLKTRKSNGVKGIREITVPENPIFDMTFSFEEGRAKVVLAKDKTIYLICDEMTKGPVSIELPAGTYHLLLVAENATRLNFTFQFNSYQ